MICDSLDGNCNSNLNFILFPVKSNFDKVVLQKNIICTKFKFKCMYKKDYWFMNFFSLTKDFLFY